MSQFSERRKAPTVYGLGDAEVRDYEGRRKSKTCGESEGAL